MSNPTPKGFISLIYDLSFNEFVTIRIIKALYLIALMIAALIAILTLFGALATGKPLAMLFGMLLTPVAFLFWSLIARVYLELIIVLFRIAENTSELVHQGSQVATKPRHPQRSASSSGGTVETIS